MFWLAASLTWFDGIAEQSGQLARGDQQLYSAISRSIVSLQDGSLDRVAAAIGGRMVVTHVAGTPSNFVTARMQDGHTIRLTYVGRDPNSQLTAYSASQDFPDTVIPVHVADRAPLRGATVLAVLSNSAVRSVIARVDGFGILNGTRRMIPLYEVRFEASPEAVGGALVFTTSGQLVSAVSAALRSPETGKGLTSLNGLNRRDFKNQARGFNSYGPAGQAIAYVPSIELTKRVIDGFLSPSHEVVHPALGVFCTDNLGLGAVVQRVTAGSPAALAGLKVGDVIMQIGNSPIRNQIDFARVMFGQHVGSKVIIQLNSGSKLRVVDVVVGKQID